MYLVQTVQTASPWRPQLPLPKDITSHVNDMDNKNSNKKEGKKWSLGNLFRRNKSKKEVDSDYSSSEEDRKAGFTPIKSNNTSKRKKKRNGNKLVGAFDHIVIHQAPAHAQSQNSIDKARETESINSIEKAQIITNGTGSLDRRIRREKVKASRDVIEQGGSSSEEGSIQSSQMSRFRSDDSLGSSAMSSRRSRAARTERYLKRLSKDDEVSPVNVGRWHTQPVPSSAYHGSINSIDHSFKYGYGLQVPPYTRSSNSLNNIHPTTYHNYSSYNQQPIYRNVDPAATYENSFYLQSRVSSLRDHKSPPPIPPRDPHRRSILSNTHDSRPVSYVNQQVPPNLAFHNPITNKSNGWLINGRAVSDDRLWGGHINSTSVPPRPSSVQPEPQQKRYISRHAQNQTPPKVNVNPTQDYKYVADATPRSRKPIHIVEDRFYDDEPLRNSAFIKLKKEDSPVADRIAAWQKMEESSLNGSTPNLIRARTVERDTPPKQAPSPRSVSSSRALELMNRRNVELTQELDNLLKDDSPKDEVDNMYPPRQMEPQSSFVAHYQKGSKEALNRISPPKNKYDEYVSKQIQTKLKSPQPVNQPQIIKLKSTQQQMPIKSPQPQMYVKSPQPKMYVKSPQPQMQVRSPQPQMQVNNQLSSPPQMKLSPTQKILMSPTSLLSNQPHTYLTSPQPEAIQEPVAYRKFDSKSAPEPPQRHITKRERKSANLEEAINELELIYKSLKLSDEELMERAERQEALSPPNFNPTAYFDDDEDDGQEPDILLDDLNYRSMKRANSGIKMQESQPPFGIPIGPIAPSPNTDYLKVQPPNLNKPRFIPQRSPDLVADDLAYRNLRKDKDAPQQNNGVRHMATTPERRLSNNLTANIFNLIQKGSTKPNGGDLDQYFDEEFINHVTKKDDEEDGVVIVPKPEAPKRKHKAKPSPIVQGGAIFNLPSTLKSNSPPVPSTRAKNKQATNNSDASSVEQMEDILNAIEMEAKCTSEKLGQDLAELRKETQSVSSTSPDVNKRPIARHLENEIDKVADAANLCQKMIQNVVEPPKESKMNAEEMMKEIDETSNCALLCHSMINKVVSPKPEAPEKSILSNLIKELTPSDERSFESLSKKCQEQLESLDKPFNETDYDNLNSVDSDEDRLNEEEIDLIMKECELEANIQIKINDDFLLNVQNVDDSSLDNFNASPLDAKSSSDFVKSSSDTDNNFLKSSDLTTYSFLSSSDGFKSNSSHTSSDERRPSDSLKSTTSNEIEVEAAVPEEFHTLPRVISAVAKEPTPSPPLRLSPSEEGSQYNSTEELAMIFGIKGPTPASSSGNNYAVDLMLLSCATTEHGSVNTNPDKSIWDNYRTNFSNSLDTILEDLHEFDETALNCNTHETESNTTDSGNVSLTDFNENNQNFINEIEIETTNLIVSSSECVYKNEICIVQDDANNNDLCNSASNLNELSLVDDPELLPLDVELEMDVVDKFDDPVIEKEVLIKPEEPFEKEEVLIKEEPLEKEVLIKNEKPFEKNVLVEPSIISLRERKVEKSHKFEINEIDAREAGCSNTALPTLPSKFTNNTCNNQSNNNNKITRKKPENSLLKPEHVILACTYYGLANDNSFDFITVIAIIIAIITILALIIF